MFNSIPEAVLHYAKETPGKLCLVDDKEQVTYAEFACLIKRLSGVLRKLGVKPGDSVVAEAEQTVVFLGLELAIQLSGAVFVPLEHNCTADKIAEIVRLTGARLAVTPKQEGFDCEAKVVSLEALKCSLESTPEADFSLPQRDEVSEILFSTGTTGKEKGIVLTHKNNLALAENVIKAVAMEKDNVELIPSPMNHSHGLRRFYANMYMGGTVVLLGSVLNVKRLFFCFEEYGVNSMDLVPAALSCILKLTKGKLSEYSSQLRYIQYGAAPLSEDDKVKICALLPSTRMLNIYGSTESGCSFSYDFNVEHPKKACIGKPTCNTRAILTDDDRGELSGEGEKGLLATAGAMNMRCYFNDPEETARAMSDGVVYSNDVAYFDGDGDVILLGRKGDVINVGGKKVSPDEIEAAAKRLPEVEDCGCVPAQDKYKGQVPKLFVQMKKGQDFDPSAIRRELSGQLEPFKVPVYIEEIDLIPRSFNGKLLRKELVKLVTTDRLN